MLTQDDIKNIGVEVGKVIEHNVTPALDVLGQKIDKVEGQLGEIEQRLNIVEHKLDRVLYNELDKHERWIKQLADKVGVELKA